MYYYIVATKKPNKSKYTTSELEGYRVCPSKKDNNNIVLIDQWEDFSKSKFFSSHYSNKNVYYSFNPDTKASAKCEKRESSTGEEYLQTFKNGTVSDNLINLPDV
jgi:hypothetical protein